MHKHSTLNVIKSYLSASLALTALILLVIAIYFISEAAQQWIWGLWGILITTIFVMIGQITYAYNKNKNITTQLLATKERLANEIKHRLWAEKTTSESKIQSQLIDENFPVLFAYFTTAHRCRYHNRAYRDWFGLNANLIDGHFLQEFSSKEFYASLKNYTKDILAGKTVFNERIQKSAKGIPYKLNEQFIPHFDNKKKVIGFYTLYFPSEPEETQFQIKSTNPSSYPNNTANSSEVTAARIAQAIEEDEFHLYFQKIIPLKTNAQTHNHYEILIRMAEEENNLLPPGTFLPLVEKFKMMTRLDRWVVSHMIEWLSANQTKPGEKFCINVAKDTLECTDFPAFVQDELLNKEIPSDILCFEIEVVDALANPSATSIFAEQIRQLGCLVSLCGFSHNQASVNLLKKISVDLIKIDGGLVYNIPHDEKDLAKVAALNRVAHKIKIQTVAELVETEDIVVKLREIGVDYAQGFGIARPQPLKDLE